jgi:hypothetical protein
MSSPPQYTPVTTQPAAAHGTPVAPAPHPRHALGLPAGSVRALLAFAVLGLLWLIALHPGFGQKSPLINEKLPTVFIYLLILMVLILASFFSAHGGTIGTHISTRSPLGLPRGSVRFLLLAGYLGLAYYLYRIQPEFAVPQMGSFVLLLLILLSAFFIGHVVTGFMRFTHGGVLPAWFQDFEAWLALVAMLALGVILVVQLFINPGLNVEKKLDLPHVEAGLAGLVGLYFGARS